MTQRTLIIFFSLFIPLIVFSQTNLETGRVNLQQEQEQNQQQLQQQQQQQWQQQQRQWQQQYQQYQQQRQQEQNRVTNIYNNNQQQQRQQRQQQQQQQSQQQQQYQKWREQYEAQIKEQRKQQSLQKIQDYQDNLRKTQNELFSKIKKQKNLLKVNQEVLNDMNKLKNELTSKSWWHRQDASLLTGIIAANINATCNLIFNMLQLNPSIGGNPYIKAVNISYGTIDKAMWDGNYNIKQISEDFAKAATLDKLTSKAPMYSLTYALYEYGEKVKSSTELPESQRKMRKEFNKYFQQIDNAILKYENRIKQNEHQLNLATKINMSIDNYLQLNANQLYQLFHKE
jgi:hypothetical protein